MVRKLFTRIALGLFIVAGLGSYAAAFDEAIPTKVSLLKWNGSPPVGKLYKIVSKPSPTVSIPNCVTGSPIGLGGSLTVTLDGNTLECTLPAADWGSRDTGGWKVLGKCEGAGDTHKGFKYLNKGAPGNDPCKVIIVKPNVVKVLAKSVGGILPPGGPGSNGDVAMSLMVGNDQYCAEATVPHFKEVADKLVKMKEQSAPGQCGAADADGDGVPDDVDTCPNMYNPAQTGLEDNGDGTVTDSTTCLMWEKKDSDDATPNAANLHDVDNRYSWAGCCDGDCGSYPDYLGAVCQPNAAAAAACSAQTGGAPGCGECSVGRCDVDPSAEGAITTIWDWLVQVNAEGGSGFAGYGDWRLPSEEGCNACFASTECPCDPAELESILLEPYPCGTSPCIDPIFGPTLSYYYWSGSANSSSPGRAWSLPFDDGDVGSGVNSHGNNVRAVRGAEAPTTTVPPTTTTTTMTPTTTTTTTTLRFVDNGDGTITDNQTGLMWEKKDSDDATPNPANLHDVDNRYSWAGCCDGTCSTSDDYCQPNAAAAAACVGTVGCSECSVGTCDVDPRGGGAITTIWDWLVQVNAEGGSGFAGHGDWRLPSEEGCNTCFTPNECPCDPSELESILLGPFFCNTSPCIDPIFGPTQSWYHWSGSTVSSNPDDAWEVHFGDGRVTSYYLDGFGYIRAVRGGP